MNKADPTVTVREISTALGLRTAPTRRALNKVSRFYPPDGFGRYNARVIDLLLAMHGKEHRPLKTGPRTWLAAYLSEETHEHTPTAP